MESLGGMETHSSPFASDSTSVRNITNVVIGEPVSLYHPNDEDWVYGGRTVRRVEVPDSGVGKPEEEISSVDLSRVG